MISLIIYDTIAQIAEVPEGLGLRERPISNLDLGIFFLCVLLIIIASKINPVIHWITLKTFFVNNRIVKIHSDEYNYDFYSTSLLFLNYCLAGGFISYRLVEFYFGKINNTELLFFVSAPALLFIWNRLMLQFMAYLSGSKAVVYETVLNTVYFNYLLGFIYVIILFFLLFYTDLTAEFLLAFLIATTSFYLFRIFRSFVFSFKKKIPLYYLILYFCTLEIVPILIIYKLFEVNFLG